MKHEKWQDLFAVVNRWLDKLVKGIVQKEMGRPLCYGSAVVLAGASLFLSLKLGQFMGALGMPLSLLATIVIALFCGFGPGLLTAFLTGVGLELFLFLSEGRSTLGLHSALRLVLFLSVAALVGSLVSALRGLFEKAEAARAKAEKISQEKDAVIEFLSHDLRGPLSSISLSFQLVQRYLDLGGKEDEIRRLASNGVFFCQRMAQLIQNLLDASKIRSEGIRLAPSRWDLAEVVEEVVKEHRLLAEEKGLSFRFEPPLGGPLHVLCDKILLAQVVANLIQNAFKFTPRNGSVMVCLKEVEGWARIQVSDTGQGIAAREAPLVFEKFWQAKKTTGEGAGLGLFLSRAIIEAHRGEIGVESQAGRGTTFWFTLPLAGPQQVEPLDAGVSLCSASSQRRVS